MEPGYPEGQRTNLLRGLLSELTRFAETEGISHNVAFRQQALEWLGVAADDETYQTDGAGDRGIDCYRFSNDALEIYQFKSQDFLSDVDCVAGNVGVGMLADVPRIATLLSTANQPLKEANRQIKQFVKQLQGAMRTFQQAEQAIDEANDIEQRTFTVVLTLAVLANGLSAQAREEFESLRHKHALLSVCGTDVLCDIRLLTLDDFLSMRWKTQNVTWRDSRGKNDDNISLRIEGPAISDRAGMVFYTRAIDLVDAYSRFGYRIFEPNVRCEIRRSSVNREISAQVKTLKGIKDFKHLNNGVTIVCETRSKNGNSIRVKRPGVVNGLQTVSTLASTYGSLSAELKHTFDDDCHVLVRLYFKDKISVPSLVKATNNQNPMEPRNLRSNDDEQIVFERLFAEQGWFYERKQFAWDAFAQDEASWPTLKNKRKKNFQVKLVQGRPITKLIDNQDLMQTWLSFCGFVNEAVQRRRDFFVIDRFYDRVFKSRINQHGYDYEFQWGSSKIDDEASPEAPAVSALIISHLTYRLANSLIPSSREHRQQCIARLGLGGKTREEQDLALNDDTLWLAGLIRSAAPMLFTELCGFVLFRSLGTQLYSVAPKLLTKTDLEPIFSRLDDSAVEHLAHSDSPAPKENEIFSQLWFVFNDLVERLAEDQAWRSSFFQQSSRPRFMYSPETRKRLLKNLEQYDKTCASRGLKMVWSEHFDQSKGVFKSVSKLAKSL